MRRHSPIVFFLLVLALGACGPPSTEEPTPLPSPSPTWVQNTPVRPTQPSYPVDATPHVLTPVPASPGGPYPSPDLTPEPTRPPLLYFLSDRGGQVDLWRFDLADELVAQVSDDEIEERWPALSPDARWLAYVALEEAQATIRLLDLATGTGPVVDGSAAMELGRPMWLDEVTLLYMARVSLDEMVPFRAMVAEPGQRLVVDGLPAGAVVLDWSAAAGRLVLVAGILGESSDLYRADIAEDHLILGASLGEGYRPQLSPDGHYLAYQAPPYDDDPAGYILDLDTGEVVSYNQAEPLRRWDHDLAWAHDGARLALSRSSWAWTGEDGRPFYVGEAADPLAIGGVEGLYVVEVVGPAVRQATQVGYDTMPAWSPDGRWLAFVGNRSQFARMDIWLLDVTSGEARALTGVEGNDWAPFWGPR